MKIIYNTDNIKKCQFQKQTMKLPKKFWSKPAVIAVKNAAMGRKMVMIGSNRAYVTARESTPVSGVAIINDMAAPSFAPCFFRLAVVGKTPHEHNGRGIPNSAA